MYYNHNKQSYVFTSTLIALIALAGSVTLTPAQAACPCPTTVDRNPAFIACNTQSNSIDTNQLVVHGSACFQGPAQLCSGTLGLAAPVLEGLWIIENINTLPGPGISALQSGLFMSRSFQCTGTEVTLGFNQQTTDPADAFTLLKTIQPGDSLQFTQIDPISCEVVSSVNACARETVGGCGPQFFLTVFNASGLTTLYNATGNYVSLLNFGSKPEVSIQAGLLLSNTGGDCTNCTAPDTPDTPCWPATICSGLMIDFIPVNCATAVFPGATRVLVNAGNLGAATTIAVPKTTLGGFSVEDILCAIRVGDRIRLYTPGISNATPLNVPPGQLGWATALSGLFGASTGSGDRINDVAVDSQGNIIVVGFHTPLDNIPQFAAAQLVPTVDGQDVTLGWSTTLVDPFGPATDLGDIANGVVIDENDNIIIGGFHEPSAGNPGALEAQFAVLQLEPNGTLAWATAIINPFGVNLQSPQGAQANDVILDTDGGIILAGTVNPAGGGQNGAPHFAALKLPPNSSGIQPADWVFLQPDSLFGIVGGAGDNAEGVALDQNGNILLAGFHQPQGNPALFAALQLVPTGSSVNLGWFIAPDSFGPREGIGDRAQAIVVDCNNNVVLAGFRDPQVGGNVPRFAALQLKQVGTGVQVGWTADPAAPFGPTIGEGDEAHDVLIDHNNNFILAGFHNDPNTNAGQFAALQLIPNASGNVNLGWTATVVPFGPTTDEDDRANGVALQVNNNVVLGGFHTPTVGEEQFATLQLRQPLVPAFADYTITAIDEVGEYLLFELEVIQTESSTICPNQELCIADFGFCCV